MEIVVCGNTLLEEICEGGLHSILESVDDDGHCNDWMGGERE